LSKPLSRGRKLKLEGDSSWISFQYERLPKFCFQCGVICHEPERCLKRSDLRNQVSSTQYGPWLRAPLPTRRSDRFQGGFRSKRGRTFPEPPTTDGRGGNGAKTQVSDGEPMGAFRDTPQSPRGFDGGGYPGGNLVEKIETTHPEIHFGKESVSATASLPVGFN
jgi:hypothetical protein